MQHPNRISKSPKKGEDPDTKLHKLRPSRFLLRLPLPTECQALLGKVGPVPEPANASLSNSATENKYGVYTSRIALIASNERPKFGLIQEFLTDLLTPFLRADNAGRLLHKLNQTPPRIVGTCRALNP